jgi:hypothetical protein
MHGLQNPCENTQGFSADYKGYFWQDFSFGKILGLRKGFSATLQEILWDFFYSDLICFLFGSNAPLFSFRLS